MKVPAVGRSVGASDTFYLGGGEFDRYADNLAHLSTTFRTFTPNQYAQAVVYRASGYVANGGQHEIELLLRFSISANVARGYEVLFGTRQLGNGDCAIVRWNGDLGQYDALVEVTGLSKPEDGDVCYAQIVGNIITAKVNGTTVASVDVSAGVGASNVWEDGQPGLGTWPVDGAIAANLGWRANYTAGDL